MDLPIRQHGFVFLTSDTSLRSRVPAPTGPAPEHCCPSAAPRERNTPKVRRRLEHPSEPGKMENPKRQTPKQAPGGKTHCACQDTSTSLGKTRESLPGTSPSPLTLASLGGLGRDRDALSVSMPLLRLQPSPRLPRQGGSAGPLPIMVLVWENRILILRVSWAKALFQTQRRQGKMQNPVVVPVTPQSAATSKINTGDVQTGQNLRQHFRHGDTEVQQVLVLPQHPRSIAPRRAGPPRPHDGPMAARALGLLVATPEPPGRCSCPRGYRVVPQKSLLQSILRRNIAGCVLPQQWDQMVPCHRMHRGLLKCSCSQN